MTQIARYGDKNKIYSDVIPEIMRFQTDRNLHKMEYDANNEHASIIEELMESCGFSTDKKDRPRLKEAIMDFAATLVHTGIIREETKMMNNLEHERVDAYADVIVFAIDAIMKLGYNPELVLDEAGREINSREGSMVDGKFTKDMSEEAQSKWYKADFTGCKLI